MRAVIQRVTFAEVRVGENTTGKIGPGLCAFVGVGRDDGEDDARNLAEKTVTLRIFEDEAGRMNKSLLEQGGALLAISQFTLFGDVRRGRRPSFTEAMAPEQANALFELFLSAARGHGVHVENGRFRAHMQVTLLNDGPVTILLDTKRIF